MSSDIQPGPAPPGQDSCPFCGTAFPERAYYCPNCGSVRPSIVAAGLPMAGDRRTWAWQQYRRPAKRADLRAVIKAVSAFAMITLGIQTMLMLFTLIYGIHMVVPEILDEWAGYTLFVIVPVVVTLFELSGYYLVAYYLFLVVAIVASCAWVVLRSYKTFLKELSMKATTREHSPLFETCGLLFATMFFSVVMALAFGASDEEIPDIGTVEESLFLLANASVWEEIVVRVLMIGLPMVLVDFARRSWNKNWYAYALGGGFRLGIPEVSLLIISSFVFGMAHYVTGWGAWKILPAAVGGLAFGYLFLRFGIAASIMLHFATDYLGMPIEVFESDRLRMIVGLGVLMWLGFGLIFFIYYTTRVAEFLSGKRLFETGPRAVPTPWTDPRMRAPIPGTWTYSTVPTQAPAPQPHQPPPSAPPAVSSFGMGYVCPVCGHTEARYINGRFQCLGCGHLS